MAKRKSTLPTFDEISAYGLFVQRDNYGDCYMLDGNVYIVDWSGNKPTVSLA